MVYCLNPRFLSSAASPDRIPVSRAQPSSDPSRSERGLPKAPRVAKGIGSEGDDLAEKPAVSRPSQAAIDPLGNPPLGRASQSRRDALTGRWAIFAPGRSERPA